MNREALNRLRCTSPALANDRDHFTTCGTCGQQFDCRRLGDVMYHATPAHEPLPFH